MKYKVSRKYKMPLQFEMLELGVEEIESAKTVRDVVKWMDLFAEEYVKEEKEKLKREPVKQYQINT